MSRVSVGKGGVCGSCRHMTGTPYGSHLTENREVLIPTWLAVFTLFVQLADGLMLLTLKKAPGPSVNCSKKALLDEPEGVQVVLTIFINYHILLLFKVSLPHLCPIGLEQPSFY